LRREHGTRSQLAGKAVWVPPLRGVRFAHCSLAVLSATWALASNASAHAPPHGRALLWASDAPEATPAIIATNRGLVFADAAGGATKFSLRCYEAYGGGISEPPGVFLTDAPGSLTIGVFDAVKATSDRACSFEPSAGLPAGVESLSVVVQDPSAPRRVFVTSRTFNRGAALYASEDYGRSWSARFENRTDDYFHALLTAPSDAQRLYAAGRRADRVNQKLVYFAAVSLDRGASWQDHVLPAEIIPFAVHPREPDVVFAYEPTNTLETEFRVLRSGDRAAQFQPVIEKLAQPTSLAAAGATLWLGIGGNGGLYRSSDDGQHFERVLADSVQAVTCLAQREGRLWMCANMAPNTDGVWFSDDQGGSFQKWMEFADVTEPSRCEQAEAQAVCDTAWHDFDVELHPRPADPGVDAVDAGTDGGGAFDDAATRPVDDAGAPSAQTDAAGSDAALPIARKRDSGCQSVAAGRPGALAGACLLALAALAARRRRRA
jgi:hypothetical protein